MMNTATIPPLRDDGPIWFQGLALNYVNIVRLDSVSALTIFTVRWEYYAYSQGK